MITSTQNKYLHNKIQDISVTIILCNQIIIYYGNVINAKSSETLTKKESLSGSER